LIGSSSTAATTAIGQYRLQVVGDEGAETALAVLLEYIDATAADKVGVVAVRGPALLAKGCLIYDASVNDATKKATKNTQLVQCWPGAARHRLCSPDASGVRGTRIAPPRHERRAGEHEVPVARADRALAALIVIRE
jgi:hypothetical protein